jgi:hypothetical protein
MKDISASGYEEMLFLLQRMEANLNRASGLPPGHRDFPPPVIIHSTNLSRQRKTVQEKDKRF